MVLAGHGSHFRTVEVAQHGVSTVLIGESHETGALLRTSARLPHILPGALIDLAIWNVQAKCFLQVDIVVEEWVREVNPVAAADDDVFAAHGVVVGFATRR